MPCVSPLFFIPFPFPLSCGKQTNRVVCYFINVPVFFYYIGVCIAFSEPNTVLIFFYMHTAPIILLVTTYGYIGGT